MYPICFKLITNRAQIYGTRNLSNSVFTKNFLSQCKIPQRQWYCLKLQTSKFHTTPKMNSPTFMMLSLVSVASGSYLRTWWLKKTPLQQVEILKWYKNKRHTIHGALVAISLIIIAYCSSFIKRDPVVNKPRLVMYSEAQQAQQANMLYKLIVRSKDNVVPLSDPMYLKIKNVMKNLARANRELFKHTNWHVTIVHRMFDLISVPTIMILSDGNIIVFSDIFKFIKNDDQLTFNLAHEMSHQMLLHPLEALSYELIRNLTCDAIWFLLFALYPIFNATIYSFLVYLLSMSIFCWYKRRRETEADLVGFELSAKSCIDLREVFVFWELMKKYRDVIKSGELYSIPFFNIHPPIEERMKRLNDDLPKALQLRSQADCPQLPDADPRDQLPRLLRELEDELKTDLGSLKIHL